jgi:hypothetical protein
VAFWNGEELLWTGATSLAWASLVALGLAWDARVKFRSLLDTPRPHEWDMSPVWERRSRRWQGIALVTFGVSSSLFIARIVGRIVM